MLRQTFSHIPGIGTTLEDRLWQEGFDEWSKVEPAHLKFGTARNQRILRYLEQSDKHLAANDPIFFARLLPAGQHWRLFQAFRSHIAYLDIETTGLMWPMDHITTIAIYDGRDVHHYVHGQNMDQFRHDIARYEVIVTYNGKCFDVPCIEACLGCHLPQAHIDLRYLLKSVGYSGGLKRCERALGFERPGLEDVDGFFAVLLWQEYEKTKNQSALDTLLAYNVEDVLTLERLAVFAYNRKLAQTPFAESLSLSEPTTGDNPFGPDLTLIRDLKNRMEEERVGSYWY